MPRIVDLGVTQYTWVPGDTGIANVSTPTVTELAAGVNISPYVVTTTSIGPTASDTVNERAVTDTANVVVPTVGNYEGNLVLFRDYLDGAPSEDDLLATFANGAVGFIVRRMGSAHTVGLAAADVAEVYKFRADNPQPNGGTGEGYLKLTVPLLQQGLFDVAAVVAGP